MGSEFDGSVKEKEKQREQKGVGVFYDIEKQSTANKQQQNKEPQRQQQQQAKKQALHVVRSQPEDIITQKQRANNRNEKESTKGKEYYV